MNHIIDSRRPRPLPTNFRFYSIIVTTLLYTISSPAANSRLLLIFSYSLNPDQARQNIGPDLDPKCFILHVPAERFLENFILNKSTDDKKS